MKSFPLVLFSFFCSLMIAQPSTEVYLAELVLDEGNFGITSFKNISNNEGYDSQPSFVDNAKLLYARNNNGQTDIAQFSIASKQTKWLHTKTNGGEYSPQPIPQSKNIAAVRLDPDGKQRLYRYNLSKNLSTEIIKNIEVAYFAFHDQNRVIASILSGNALDLVVIDLKEQKTYAYIENAGRSIHKVPGGNSVSYSLVNEEKNLDIYVLDIDEDGESFFVCQLPIGVQDYTWLSDSQLICGSGNQLYVYDLFQNGEWQKVADLSNYNVHNISRISVSPDQTKIALVGEPIIKEKNIAVARESASDIVQKHIAPYNAGDLKSFSECFTEEVIVRNFPDQTMYQGRGTLLENYQRFFKKNTGLSVKVLQRIELGNIVVDEESATVSGRKQRHATVYEVNNGKIASMTFVHNQRTEEDPEIIVQKQLDAYNDRNIKAFLATYSDDVSLFGFPNKLQSRGKESMRESYGSFFSNTPNLHCEIKNRIVIGNKVIDEEYLTVNGQNFSAIAIYEVENGYISRVTFIQ